MSKENQIVEIGNGLCSNNMIMVGDVAVKFNKQFVAQYLGVPNISDQNMAVLLAKAYSEHLNPITDIYVVAYGNQFSIIEKVENKLERAYGTGKLKGIREGLAVMNCNDELEVRNNCFLLSNEKIVGAWCELDTEHMGIIRKEVLFNEYDTGKSTWKEKPSTMISKVAKGQALDMAFPKMFGGLRSEEEMANIPGFEDAKNEQEVENIQAVPVQEKEEYVEAEYVEVATEPNDKEEIPTQENFGGF